MAMSESNLRNMLNAISRGNHILNEQVRLYKHTEEDCPDCGYDPIRKESTDPYCDTCEGKGKIEKETYTQIPTSIQTEDDFQFDFTQAGRLEQGEILITIDRKEIDAHINQNGDWDLDDHRSIKKLVENYDYFWWKGGKYHLKGFEPGYLQGVLYEIAVTVSLSE